MKRSFASRFNGPCLLSLLAVSAGGVSLAGCQSAGRTATSRAPRHGVVKLACLYEQKPWLNLDKAGDRDPEGIHYIIFADKGTGRGAFVDGTFLIDLYQIERDGSGGAKRTLVSDWVLPTSQVERVKSKIWGKGYHVRLRWAKKDIAGHEIELVTRFRDPTGAIVSAGIKQFRVPKYSW